MTAAGSSLREIAAVVGCDAKSVHRWLAVNPLPLSVHAPALDRARQTVKATLRRAGPSGQGAIAALQHAISSLLDLLDDPDQDGKTRTTAGELAVAGSVQLFELEQEELELRQDG